VKQITPFLPVGAFYGSSMNINVLIDAIVRQTTVLIAQLATSAGARASLSQTANQVFASLVQELKEQGLGNKVIADMFGLSLRTYHNKMRRLSESTTERGESLWSAVFEFVKESKTVTRREVVTRFERDEERVVRGVLSDLVSSGLVFATGTGDRTTYRAVEGDEYDLLDDVLQAQALVNLVWITVARHGPLHRSRLSQLVALKDERLDAALGPLLQDGRVKVSREGSELGYASDQCVIGFEEPAGWEASVFDHYQAVVIALCTKLRSGRTTAKQNEWVGGSTYGFDVWPEHPKHDEVLGFLATSRRRATELRAEVDGYNQSAVRPERGVRRVIHYMGQTVIEADEDLEESTS
jgi:hypothetical protein